MSTSLAAALAAAASGMTEAFTDHPISPETVGEISVLFSNYEPQYRVTRQGRAKITDDWARQLYRPAREGGETVAIKAIPYCVWGNRVQQKMKVWIDTTEDWRIEGWSEAGAF